jgi:hypothetical protein
VNQTGPIGYMLIGAVIVVAVYAAFLVIRKTWRMAEGMEQALRAVPAAVAAIQNLVDVARDFQKELALMRGYASGQIQLPSGESDIAGDLGGESPRPAPGPVPYPAPIFDRFTVMPPEPPADATLENSGVLDQSESDMAEVERFEQLVDLGLANRDESNHQAREVDSK